MNEERQQELIEKMKYITLLDFEIGKVFQYDIEVLDKSDEDVYERFLTNEGHNLSNCEWMIHKDSEIITL
tara:strand:- start:39 stop:248 length:210 start_codon:yes stop_codon:yes gene_type:complete